MSCILRPLAASVLALSLSAPLAAVASCGATFCSVNTSSAFMNAGLAGDTRLDLRFEFIDQRHAMHGDDNVSVGEIRRHHDEKRTVNRNLLLTLERDLAPDWTLGMTLPLIDRDHKHIHHHRHDGEVHHIPESWDFRELGDLRIKARHELLGGREQGVGVSVGVKLPTGRSDVENSDGEEAERSLQPGSGTTDVLLGAHWRMELAGGSTAFASLAAELATAEHDDYRPGHRAHLDLGWVKPISERLSIPVQLNVAFKARDRGAEAEPEDTGSTTVALSPGINWQMSPHWQLYAYYQRPIYQHVNGVQLTPRWSAVLGTTVAF
ncbi:transporter [Aromatoleum toluolicum]|uniref:Lipoprotein n=1 Tax=Aromatoleum toluolicum TaxID=90060 RepID=A0ABX1NPY5_9RHOO|nr:transporter [Aromatoleum toluolicum]NMG01109.1 transporter [Aromatoleum toluolicum]